MNDRIHELHSHLICLPSGIVFHTSTSLPLLSSQFDMILLRLKTFVAILFRNLRVGASIHVFQSQLSEEHINLIGLEVSHANI